MQGQAYLPTAYSCLRMKTEEQKNTVHLLTLHMYLNDTNNQEPKSLSHLVVEYVEGSTIVVV